MQHTCCPVSLNLQDRQADPQQISAATIATCADVQQPGRHASSGLAYVIFDYGEDLRRRRWSQLCIDEDGLATLHRDRRAC